MVNWADFNAMYQRFTCPLCQTEWLIHKEDPDYITVSCSFCSWSGTAGQLRGKSNISPTQVRVATWIASQWGKLRPESLLERGRKYWEEARELEESVFDGSPRTERIKDEAADVAITLYAIAEAAGFDLDQAIKDKMSINESRRYYRDDQGRVRREGK